MDWLRRGLLAAAAAMGAGKATARTSGWATRPDPDSLTLAQLIATSRATLELLTTANLAIGIGNTERWEADLDAGTIAWVNDRDGTRRSAAVQVIGTYNTDDGTWLWGWHNPSVRAPLAQDAARVRAYGQRHGVANYTTPMISCTQEDAWDMTAVACFLAERQGAYRGPAGATMVFMTYGTVRIEQPRRPN